MCASVVGACIGQNPHAVLVAPTGATPVCHDMLLTWRDCLAASTRICKYGEAAPV